MFSHLYHSDAQAEIILDEVDGPFAERLQGAEREGRLQKPESAPEGGCSSRLVSVCRPASWDERRCEQRREHSDDEQNRRRGRS